MWVIASVIGLSLALRFYIYIGLGWINPWYYRFFPTELALFLMGAVSYRIYVYIKARPTWNPSLIPISGALLLGTVFYRSLVPAGILGCWLYFLVAMLALPFLFRLTCHWRWDSRIGELSYPLCLVHHLFALMVKAFVADFAAYRGVIVASVSLGVSWLLIRFVSDPIEKGRQKRVHAVQHEK